MEPNPVLPKARKRQICILLNIAGYTGCSFEYTILGEIRYVIIFSEHFLYK